MARALALLLVAAVGDAARIKDSGAASLEATLESDPVAGPPQRNRWLNLSRAALNGGMTFGQGVFNNYLQQQRQQQAAAMGMGMGMGMDGMGMGPQQPWNNVLVNGTLNAGQAALSGFAGVGQGQGPPGPCPCNHSNPYAQVIAGLGRGVGAFGANIFQNLQNARQNSPGVPWWQQVSNATASAWQQQAAMMQNGWAAQNLPGAAGTYANQLAGQMGNVIGNTGDSLAKDLATKIKLDGIAAKLGLSPEMLSTALSSGQGQALLNGLKDGEGKAALQNLLGEQTNSLIMSLDLASVAQKLGVSPDQLKSVIDSGGAKALLDHLPAGEAKTAFEQLLKPDASNGGTTTTATTTASP